MYLFWAKSTATLPTPAPEEKNNTKITRSHPLPYSRSKGAAGSLHTITIPFIFPSLQLLQDACRCYLELSIHQYDQTPF